MYTVPTMKIFTGGCSSSERTPVVGRLLFDKAADITPTNACLTVLEGHLTREQLENPGMVGVIWIGTEPPQELFRLPCPVLTLPELPASCHGQIALLDPSCSSLFVSPDLRTVNRYTRLSGTLRPSEEEPLLLPNGRRLRLSTILSDLADRTAVEADGYLADLPLLSRAEDTETEESVYERIRDIAEGRTGLPLTVSVPFDRAAPDNPIFRARIRGLFRGAVWGNFSLLLGGILTEADLRIALEVIHRLFCELESEGREFNGYIPKGILLDTPLLLTADQALDGIDLLCFDLCRLTALMTGGVRDNTSHLSHLSLLREPLRSASLRFRHLRQTALTDHAAVTAELAAFLCECSIAELFLPSSSRYDAYRALRSILYHSGY